MKVVVVTVMECFSRTDHCGNLPLIRNDETGTGAPTKMADCRLMIPDI